MQLARDGKIILDLDDSAGANHISTDVKYFLPSRQQRPTRSYQQRESCAIGSQGLFTIQFRSLAPVIVPLMVRGLVVQTNPIPIEDEEGWALVTRRRPRSPKQAQAPPFAEERGRVGGRVLDVQKLRKSQRQTRGKKFSLLKQEPLVPITLGEFFPVDFFEKVAVNMTSCYDLEDKEDEKEEKLEKPPKSDDEALTILETLPTCDDWR